MGHAFPTAGGQVGVEDECEAPRCWQGHENSTPPFCAEPPPTAMVAPVVKLKAFAHASDSASAVRRARFVFMDC